jgi:hypothetical protein
LAVNDKAPRSRQKEQLVKNLISVGLGGENDCWQDRAVKDELQEVF